MFPAQVSSSPWGLASRVCFIPTPNSLGGLGLGCAKLAVWPCSPASSSASPHRAQRSLPLGLQLIALGFPSRVISTGRAGKQGLRGGKSPKSPWAEQGSSCPAFRASPPLCPVPSAGVASVTGIHVGRDVTQLGSRKKSQGGMSGSHVLSVLQIPEFQAQPVWASPCCQLLLLEETWPFPEAGLTHIPLLLERSRNGG